MFKKVRSLVSQDKLRYRDGVFDLDLTYIGRRVIAMGFPAAGLEGLFRNQLNNVAAMLRKYHEGHFMIVNVSERDYNRSVFGQHRVLDAPFPDHFNPPLELLFRIVYEIHAYLTESPANVVIVHCLAGRGRTGTVISCYLYLLGLYASTADALDFFALRRSLTQQGVTKPSQRRYVRYFTGVVASGREPAHVRVALRRLVFHGVPTFQGKSETHAGCRPVVNVYTAHTHPPTLVFSTLWWTQTHVVSYRQSDGFVLFDLDGVVVAGDILIRAYHMPLRTKVVEESNEMFRVSLHTAFIDSAVVLLQRAELDGAHAHHEGRFPDDFAVMLVVDLAPERATHVPVHAARMRECALPPLLGHWAELRRVHCEIKATKDAARARLSGSWRDGYVMPPKPPELRAAIAASQPFVAPGVLLSVTETERVLSNGERLLDFAHAAAVGPERTAARPISLRFDVASAGSDSPFAIPFVSANAHAFATLHEFVALQIATAAREQAAAELAARAAVTEAARSTGAEPPHDESAALPVSGATGGSASDLLALPLGPPFSGSPLVAREARMLAVARKSRADLANLSVVEQPDSVDASLAVDQRAKRYSRIPEQRPDELVRVARAAHESVE